MNHKDFIYISLKIISTIIWTFFLIVSSIRLYYPKYYPPIDERFGVYILGVLILAVVLFVFANFTVSTKERYKQFDGILKVPFIMSLIIFIFIFIVRQFY